MARFIALEQVHGWGPAWINADNVTQVNPSLWPPIGETSDVMLADGTCKVVMGTPDEVVRKLRGAE